jgi:hypothetical protein
MRSFASGPSSGDGDGDLPPLWAEPIHIPSFMTRLGREPEEPMVLLYKHLVRLDRDLDAFFQKKGLMYKTGRWDDPFTGKLYSLLNKIKASQGKEPRP